MSWQQDQADGRRRARPRPLLWLGLILPALFLGQYIVSQGLDVRGRVVDATTGQPLAEVEVQGAAASVRSDSAGAFRLSPVSLGESVSFSHAGYLPRQARAAPLVSLDVALQPRQVLVVARNAESGEPVAAEVRVGDVLGRPTDDGSYAIAPARLGASVTAVAPGFRPGGARYDGQERLEIALQPIYGGEVRDGSTGQPVRGASVAAGGWLVKTDERGRFELPGRPSGDRAHVLAPGYLSATVDFSSRNTADVSLKPFAAHGIYLTFFAVGNAELRANVIDLVKNTALNTVVVDVKGDRGWIAYPSSVPLAAKIGANDVHTLDDVDQFLRQMEDLGVYTIARIVVFKDDLLARQGASAGVDVSIKDARTGMPWLDGEGLGWVDPLRPEAWDYNVALAREAALKGFDEIQFDYIRFPTDPGAGTSLESAVYSQPATEERRVEALGRFLSQARDAVHQAGAYLSIDTFGYSCWADDDMGIGQDLARLAPHVDYISPMIYPSTFSAGLPGGLSFPAVVQEPYEVVRQSLLKAQERVAGSGALLRPWLQYFDDYPWATGFRYDAPQIVAQRQASSEAGAVGWLYWDPTSTYQRGGLD